MRRRSIGIGLGVLLVVLAAIGIGVGAYNFGLSEGLARAGDGTEVVRVIGRGYGPGFGFFPIGLILFPLFLIGIFALARAAFWRGRWGGPGAGPGGYGPGGYGRPGPWGWDGPDAWHRRQHGQPGPAEAGTGHGPERDARRPEDEQATTSGRQATV